jgi:sporulation protein YlmC with PRC-barrel domain
MNHRVQTTWILRGAIAAALVAGSLAGSAGSTALAQPAKTVGTNTVDIKPVDLHTWKVDTGTGWSVKNLIGKKVKSAKGEDVAEVDNIVFGPDGEVRQLIVSTLGILGFGEKNLAVNWSGVTVGPNNEYVTTPITAESVKKYGLFDGIAKSSGPIAPRDWRSSELIGNYVNLKGNIRYAYVHDLIVSKKGKLQAVIVRPSMGYDHGAGGYAGGYYAYPFYDYSHAYGYGHHEGWNPGSPSYNLPYTKADIAELLPFVYNRQ